VEHLAKYTRWWTTTIAYCE